MKKIIKKTVYKIYAPVRMNPKALERFSLRKEEMEKIINNIVKKKKKIKISYPRFFDIISEVPTQHINDEYILRVIRGKKKI